MKSESLAKAYILTHGVQFSDAAIQHATDVNAKRQNMVYNLPAADSSLNSQMPSIGFGTPQELFLSGEDGYTVCVSAVSPVETRKPAIVDFHNGQLSLTTPSQINVGDQVTSLKYVTQPEYYDLKTASGRPVQRWVSACGYDELNVWPWHDCSVSQVCSFCGINTVQKKAGRNVDLLHALDLRREPDVEQYWQGVRDSVISEITEAVDLAVNDKCYSEEVHLILISGNLADNQLNTQAIIYAEIAHAITQQHPGRFKEGAVVVTAPPTDLRLLGMMKESGVSIGVFNLEAFTPSEFLRHCPGKARIGRNHYLKTLQQGVKVFGWGRSWCNFVLGLEQVDDLLSGCNQLAADGITPGANVLHRDHGATLRTIPPDYDTVIYFYTELAKIYHQYNHHPYYCQLALRTSLANEAFAGRLG